MSISVKPPLGLRPRYIVDKDRALEILNAFYNYIEANRPVEDEWLNEFKEINDRIAIKDKFNKNIRTIYPNL